MITAILLIWIGAQLNAPTWYYVLVSIGIFFRIMQISIDMYKKGKEDK